MLISLKYFISEILSKLLHCVRTLEPKFSLFQPGRSSLTFFRLFSSATTSAIDSPTLRTWSTPSSTSWVKIDRHSLPARRIAVEPSSFGLGLGLGCQIQNSSSPLQTARALSFIVSCVFYLLVMQPYATCCTSWLSCSQWYLPQLWQKGWRVTKLPNIQCQCSVWARQGLGKNQALLTSLLMG